MEYAALNNGVVMPKLGYGVFQLDPEECERCVSDALGLGYRLIDTAQSYGNEEAVGAAIARSGVPRGEIFLGTKVWIGNYGYEECRESVFESLRKLKTDYLDLCILHQPFSDVFGAYRALEDLYEEGILKAIGISNFTPDRMIDVVSFSRIKPQVNQVEIHPFRQLKQAKKWHDKYGVQLQAWGPYGQGKSGVFSLPVLVEIGERYGKSAAQVIARWHLQRDLVLIPKSTKAERMKENIDVFDFSLSEEEMDAIAGLDREGEARFAHADPAQTEFFVELAEQRKKPGQNLKK